MRGGTSVGQTGPLLGDALFSKELENMGKQLAGTQLCVHVCVLCVCVCVECMHMCGLPLVSV